MAAIEFYTRGFRERSISLDDLWSSRVDATHPELVFGSDADAVDIVVADRAVSGVHAALARIGTHYWMLRDLTSRNGTYVNRVRLVAQQHRLEEGHEVVMGKTHMIFRDVLAPRRPKTDALVGPPADLTRGERRVLIELCRPLLSFNAFQLPASVVEIADRLGVGKNAVQAHLTNLYEKFAIYDGGENRRVRLANEAIERGAVTRGDLQPPAAGRDGRG